MQIICYVKQTGSELQAFTGKGVYIKRSLSRRRSSEDRLFVFVNPALSFPAECISLRLRVLVHRDLVDEAKNYLLLPQERPLMQGPRTRPRKPIRCGEVLFAGRYWSTASGDWVLLTGDPPKNDIP